MSIALDFAGVEPYLTRQALDDEIGAHAALLETSLYDSFGDPAQMGWLAPAAPEQERILETAEQVRAQAEVFVLVGVGGSNRGARAVIDALHDRQVEIVYAGDTLSAQALQDVLRRLEGKSVYLNAIAKDFNTLEPGIHFRFLRDYLYETYGSQAGERIIVTGSRGPGQLYELSQAHGYTFFPFPADMGGRFSVISPVGLLPMAVAGVDIQALVEGAAQTAAELKSAPLHDNPAVRYAASRNRLFDYGFVIENLVAFEPALHGFTRWWTQLYGESEGKNQACIFPTSSSYSEDLHAIGQYIQDGRRMIMETFLDAFFASDLSIPSSAVKDGFDYLDGKPYSELNRAVYQAAYQAHHSGGVPCTQLHCEPIDAPLFGRLFYFFMLSCCFSASLIGVNPFGQAGVEAYKRSMYRLLGKPAK